MEFFRKLGILNNQGLTAGPARSEIISDIWGSASHDPHFTSCIEHLIVIARISGYLDLGTSLSKPISYTLDGFGDETIVAECEKLHREVPICSAQDCTLLINSIRLLNGKGRQDQRETCLILFGVDTPLMKMRKMSMI